MMEGFANLVNSYHYFRELKLFFPISAKSVSLSHASKKIYQNSPPPALLVPIFYIEYILLE